MQANSSGLPYHQLLNQMTIRAVQILMQKYANAGPWNVVWQHVSRYTCMQQLLREVALFILPKQQS
jgi:hypothetical protein